MDAYAWNNAANWDVGSRGSETHAVPAAGDTVIFGAVSGDPETMKLDLTGMNPVGQFLVEGATAPAYQFGTSVGTSQSKDDGQSFWIAPAGVMTIAEEVTRNQTFMRLAFDPVDKSTVALTNNSQKASFVWQTLNRSSSHSQVYTFSFGGAGQFVAHTNQYHRSGGQVMIFNGTGPIVWRNVLNVSGDNFNVGRPMKISETAAGVARDFSINRGAGLYVSNGTSPFTGFFETEVDARVHGEGFVAANTHVNSATGDGNEAIRGMGLMVSGSRKTMTVDVPLMPWNSDRATKNDWWDGYIPLVGNANTVINLNSTNGCTRACRLYGQVRVNAKKIGNAICAGDDTSIGPGEIVLSPYFDIKNSQFRLYYRMDCTLAYAGETATSTDRNILLTNATYEITTSAASGLANSSVATGTVANAGSGQLTLTGQVRALNPDATFVLKPETAPIAFAGSFAASPSPAVRLAIRGAEEVQMASVPANIGALDLLGGTLRLTRASTVTAPVAAFGTGNRVIVDEGASLTVDTTPADLVANGAVDFAIGQKTVVTFTGATSATTVPANLTVNGGRADFTDEGRLVEHASYWKAATDGTWKTQANWELNTVPTGDCDARIAIGGADYTVTIDETPTAVNKVFVGQGDTGYTSTLSVQADLSTLATTYAVTAGGALEVGKDGKLDAANATVKPSSDGVVRVLSGGTFAYPAPYTISSGDWLVKDDGALTCPTGKGLVYMKPSDAGETVSLTFDLSEKKCRGGSTTEQGRFYLGNCVGGTAMMDFIGYGYSSSSATYSFFNAAPYGYYVGWKNGLGTINVTNGCLVAGNNGFFVGTADIDSIAQAATGVVNQVDSYVDVGAYSAPSSGRMLGVIIGSGDYFDRSYVGEDMEKLKIKGTWNLKGGVLNNRGYLIVGAGLSEGALYQTGGSLLKKDTITSSVYTNHLNRTLADGKAARTFRYPLIIGLQGGKGLYEISGGTATVTMPVLIAGCFTEEDIPYGLTKTGTDILPSDTCYPYDHDSDAVGCLRVKGGSVSLSDVCKVGLGGTGTIEMVGTNGTLTVGQLVAANGANSVLSFVCDKSDARAGVSPITVTGELNLDNTTLTVDLGENYAGTTRLRLISAPTITGNFGSVTVTGNLSANAKIVKEADGVYLQLRRGFALMFR